MRLCQCQRWQAIGLSTTGRAECWSVRLRLWFIGYPQGGKVERRLGCVILVLCAVLSGFAPRSLPVERTSGAQERAPASVIGVAVLPVHATGEPAAGKEEKANTHLVLATNDMGPDLVQRLSIGTPPIDPQAILFLINAVYFRGDWQDPFGESATRDLPFTRSDATHVTVPMMSRYGSYRYADSRDYQAVRLP